MTTYNILSGDMPHDVEGDEMVQEGDGTLIVLRDEQVVARFRHWLYAVAREN